MTTDEIDLSQMSSPLWRIRNIYTIRDREGKPLKFTPTPEQEEVLRQVYILKRKKIFIPKARQLGMSTLVSIMILDSILFGSGVQISISDFVSGNAKKKLEEKIIYAFQRLPKEWKDGWEIVVNNRQTGEFRVKRKGADKEHESAVYAGDAIRGGTNQMIHLSELGETQIRAPERARETIEGGLPSAENAIIIIETTWHGGKQGQLYRIIKDALETPDDMKDINKDFFVIFFSWDSEPSYTHNGDPAQILPEIHDYFSKLSAKNGKTYTPGQRLWYQREKAKFGEKIYSIYPSELDEIFLSPVEGAIFAREVDKARTEGRVSSFTHDPTRPVHTLWDIGAAENTIVWYFQIIGGRYRFIDIDVVKNKKDEISGIDLTFPERVRHMNGKPYKFGYHYLPHDGRNKTDLRNKTTAQEDLIKLGLNGSVIVVPRITQKWLSIDKTKQIFTLMDFDAGRCAPALDALAMYRRRQDPFDDSKFTNEIEHDWTSHIADSLMQLATALIYNYLGEEGNEAMTNLLLDPDRLKEMSHESVNKRPSIGMITKNGGRVMFVKDEKNPWLKKWEDPAHGRSYLTVINDGIVQTWRAAYTDLDGKDKPMLLVASIIPQKRYDEDVLAEWASMMSKLYGDCIVVPTIGTRDGIITRLYEMECHIFRRDVSDAQKPVGRSRPLKKPGFDLTEPLRIAAMDELVRMVRDKKIEFLDSDIFAQALTYTVSPDGIPAPEPGHSGSQIETAGIACLTINVASEFGR
jgi:hypothetical protein